MSLVKTINKKQILLLTLLVVFYLILQIPHLGREAVNPDAVNWHYRSEQFVVGLKNSLWEKTYQHYHPGVTLMWITGIPIELFKQVTGVEVYNQYSFYAFHFIAKFSLIFTQLTLVILVIYWLSKITGFYQALLTGLFFLFEPFVLGDARLYHMDILFTVLVFSALLLSYLAVKEKKSYWALLSGIFAALSFLTRSLGLGVYLFVIFAGGLHYFLKERNFKKPLKFAGLLTAAFVFTTFLLFPALWVKPLYVLVNIFTEGARIGVRGGHSQIFFGKYTENPGWFFYPVVLLLKTSPFLLLGVFYYKFSAWQKFYFLAQKKKIISRISEVSLTLYLTVFYLGYFLIMSFPAKKLDRYMLVIYPLLAIFAVQGYNYFFQKTAQKRIFTLMIAALFVIFVLRPDITYFPDQFIYTNPLFGSSTQANKIIGQKSFGLGIFEVKKELESRYGSQVKVGFIDTKPIKAIYPNSLVSDIRINGVSDYDVLVLAVNEEIPQKVLKTGVKFTKDHSIYIHGLEYWRFYVKEK